MKKLSFIRSVSSKSIALFLMFLLPIYLTGFGIFSRGRELIRQQTREAQENRAMFYMENLDAEISRIRFLQYDFLSDRSLNRLTDTLHIMSNYDRDMNVLSVQNRLKTIMNSSRYIQDAKIIMPGINQEISMRSMSDLPQEDLELLDRIDSLTTSGSYYDYDAGMIYLHAAAHIGYNPQNRALPKYCVEIGLSVKEIASTTEDLLQNGEDYIYYGSSGDIVKTSLDGGGDAGGLPEKLRRGGTSLLSAARSIRIGNRDFQICAVTSEDIDLTYVSVLNEADLYRSINAYFLLFVLFSFIVLLVIFLFAYSFRRVIHMPLNRLRGAFKEVEKGNFEIEIQHSAQDEFREIFDAFNHMTGRLDRLIEQVYRQKLLAQNAELRQLQAQINPHFLFNCFFILKRRIAYGDIETASLLADHLGEYFQYITRTASSTIPLSEEIRHAKIYTDIQASRFSDRIKIDFPCLPPKYAGIMVDRLILQPIIENAFEYGLEDKAGEGILRVSFREEDEAYLIISVEENGDTLDDEAIESLRLSLENTDREREAGEREITGIINIHRRIRYHMGGNAGIRLYRSELGGLRAELRIALPGRAIDSVQGTMDN